MHQALLLLHEALPWLNQGFLFRQYWVSNFDELAEYAKKYTHDIRANVYYENAEKYSRGTDLHGQLMAVVDGFVKEKTEKDYQEALQLMQQKGYVSAAEIFGKLSGYRDADQLCKKCCEEASRLEAERKAEEEQALQQGQ